MKAIPVDARLVDDEQVRRLVAVIGRRAARQLRGKEPQAHRAPVVGERVGRKGDWEGGRHSARSRKVRNCVSTSRISASISSRGRGERGSKKAPLTGSS